MEFYFSRLESHGIQLLVHESHGKLKFCLIDYFLQMTMQRKDNVR